MTPIRRRRRRARTQRNSNYRRIDEYQSDRGNPVWLLFFIERVGNRGRLQMGHELRESKQHCIRYSQRKLFQREPDSLVSRNNLLLSGLCRGPGHWRQKLHRQHLLRQHPELHNRQPQHLAHQLRNPGNEGSGSKCKQHPLRRTLLPRHLLRNLRQHKSLPLQHLGRQPEGSNPHILLQQQSGPQLQLPLRQNLQGSPLGGLRHFQQRRLQGQQCRKERCLGLRSGHRPELAAEPERGLLVQWSKL